VRGKGGGRGPHQSLRSRPRLPHAGMQNVCDAERRFLDGSRVQGEGAAARTGRGAVCGRPETEVGGVEGSQSRCEHPGGVSRCHAGPGEWVSGWGARPSGGRSAFVSPPSLKKRDRGALAPPREEASEGRSLPVTATAPGLTLKAARRPRSPRAGGERGAQEPGVRAEASAPLRRESRRDRGQTPKEKPKQLSPTS
jgi:hypothetical protein